jgi:hypothetical protein
MRKPKGRTMKRLASLLAVILAFGGAVDAASIAVASTPASRSTVAVIAKRCRSGYTHAVIGGAQKCLHAGEYCAHRYGGQYRRYHFKCVIVHRTYRLERA